MLLTNRKKYTFREGKGAFAVVRYVYMRRWLMHKKKCNLYKILCDWKYKEIFLHDFLESLENLK